MFSHLSFLTFADATMSSSTDASCYTVVFEDSSESPSIQELRSGLEKGSDEVKFDTLRKIIVSTINGNATVCRPSDESLQKLIDILLTAPAFDANYSIRTSV